MKKLTLVVGAGASCEFGLPTGAQLKSAIAELIDIKYDFDRRISGDHLINEALRQESHRLGISFNALLHSCWHVRDALPQAISIDNLIDSQRSDKVELIGKLAIARAILRAEQESKLHIDPRGDRQSIPFGALADSWLNAIFQLITQNCALEDLGRRFSQIGFVIFNYDRCIEHYLLHAITNYYQVNEQVAAGILSKASFYHPYGTVGSLPWQGQSHQVAFGGHLGPHDLINHAGQVRTFTEGTDPSDSQILAIKDAIQTSGRLLFLGFAYHQLNMRLIDPGSPAGDGLRRHSFGTAFGMSTYNAEAIAREISTMQGSSRDDVHIRVDLRCADIFQEFSRGISIE